MKPLMILASSSPRRTALLTQIGMAHRVMPAAIDEHQLPGEDPLVCVTRLARQKAQHVYAQLLPGTRLPVLGADTAVLIDGEMLGKPTDRAHAMAMLARLAGRVHRVVTAVALVGENGVSAALSDSEVRLCAIAATHAEAYWDSGEPSGKAGGYAIQGFGAVWVESIRGSYSGVMGLPLFETAQLLRAAGLLDRCGVPS